MHIIMLPTYVFRYSDVFYSFFFLKKTTNKRVFTNKSIYNFVVCIFTRPVDKARFNYIYRQTNKINTV